MEIEKFIEDVRSHREIYDKVSKDYKNNVKKDILWETLTRKYGFDGEFHNNIILIKP